MKNEYKLKNFEIGSTNLMLHLPTSPDNLSMQENWENSYFSDHLQVVFTTLGYVKSTENFQPEPSTVIEKTKVEPQEWQKEFVLPILPAQKPAVPRKG
jgi:hypothetical protein